METMELVILVVQSVIGGTVGYISFWVGIKIGVYYERERAIEAGVGRWVVGHRGRKTFLYYRAKVTNVG